MNYNHVPVLLNECIAMLNIKSDGVYIDGTIGGAGHSVEILKKLGHGGVLIGLDKDAAAIETSRGRLEKIKTEAKIILVNSNFKYIKEICFENGISEVDGILLDLGVSSHQFDEVERGFSYQNDGPLDMRMDRSQGLTAEIIVNEYEEKEIARIIREYGEEKWASRIASFIVKAREKKRICSTREFVDIIKAAIPAPARRKGPHPAKRTFQALRIAVNDELGVLKETINDAVSILKERGRLCIISFHSLEDRIVKTEFQRMVNPCTCPKEFPACMCGKKTTALLVTKKPITPSEEELNSNPRARSAKLRVLEKV
ncbi:MAG: 16S rRNA (cytosine(1402)-N(4))-methyltransferase RsmH [Firmicutes bacterium]|nr:16S rRNA (cytosine(1402)-N(4))-methyltransferase RsmH [Bacillota bacterium]